MPPVLGPVAVGDMMEVYFEGSLFNQRTLNKFNYICTEAPAVAMDRWNAYSEIRSHFGLAGGLKESFLAPLSNEFELLSTRYQIRAPERLIYRRFSELANGDIASVASTVNLGASIERRANEALRTNVGRIAVPGLPAASYLEGNITAAAILLLEDLASEMRADVITATAGTWRPCLWTENPAPATPTFNGYVVDTQVHTTARVQRRRTVGLGI